MLTPVENGLLEEDLSGMEYKGFVQYKGRGRDGFRRPRMAGFATLGTSTRNLMLAMHFADAVSYFAASPSECPKLQEIEDRVHRVPLEVLLESSYREQNMLEVNRLIRDNEKGIVFRLKTGYLLNERGYRKGYGSSLDGEVYSSECGDIMQERNKSSNRLHGIALPFHLLGLISILPSTFLFADNSDNLSIGIPVLAVPFLSLLTGVCMSLRAYGLAETKDLKPIGTIKDYYSD
ncbi:MAG: hypothetical protein Q8P57_03180 [Candidatus Pacearchaeota archaeon]|nr:hypothetical protein [Candidatus Pacearchaeota archaeon]